MPLFAIKKVMNIWLCMAQCSLTFLQCLLLQTHAGTNVWAAAVGQGWEKGLYAEIVNFISYIYDPL